MNLKNDIRTFYYGTHQFRVLVNNKEPRFIATDLAKLLQLGECSKACKGLKRESKQDSTKPEVWKESVWTTKGEKTMLVVPIQSAEKLIEKSNADYAKHFLVLMKKLVFPKITKPDVPHSPPEPISEPNVPHSLPEPISEPSTTPLTIFDHIGLQLSVWREFAARQLELEALVKEQALEIQKLKGRNKL